LGREADPAGLAAYSAALAVDGDITALIKGLSASPEHHALQVGRCAPELVTGVFHALLGRAPTADECREFAQRLQAAGDIATVVREVAGFEEHREWMAAQNATKALDTPPVHAADSFEVQEQRLDKPIRKAIALLAYSRLDYFELVLTSLLAQQCSGRPVRETHDIHIFQDGLWREEPPQTRAQHARLAAMLETLPSHIRVHRQRENLGVALHFDFAERLLFLDQAYDHVIFCEDDLVLAPGYIHAVDLMAERFRDDPRIGLISANPGATTEPLEVQRRQRADYCSMGHNWGFGISRTFWQRRQQLVDEYLKLVGQVPYRQRRTDKIGDWLQSIGFHAPASSQDYIKQCAQVGLGTISVSTRANYGLPIGRSGLHCTPELFEKMGFDRTVVCDTQLDAAAPLDDACYQAIFEEQSARVLQNPETFSPTEWTRQLQEGCFKSDAFQDVGKFARNATDTDVIAAYKLLLGRPPESNDVVSQRIGRSPDELLEDFLRSDEFAKRTELAGVLRSALERMKSLSVDRTPFITQAS
jgi:hypothetical protein